MGLSAQQHPPRISTMRTQAGFFSSVERLLEIIYMQLSKHFDLDELTITSTGLPNNPIGAELENLHFLVDLLEQVRYELGHPVVISSGYRSPSINSIVGGSRSSAHLKGLAADFTCPGYGTPNDVCLAIIDSGLKWDQLILEYMDNSLNGGGDWVHLSRRHDGERQMVMTRLHGGRYVPGLHRIGGGA